MAEKSFIVLLHRFNSHYFISFVVSNVIGRGEVTLEVQMISLLTMQGNGGAQVERLKRYDQPISVVDFALSLLGVKHFVVAILVDTSLVIDCNKTELATNVFVNHGRDQNSGVLFVFRNEPGIIHSHRGVFKKGDQIDLQVKIVTFGLVGSVMQTEKEHKVYQELICGSVAAQEKSIHGRKIELTLTQLFKRFTRRLFNPCKRN